MTRRSPLTGAMLEAGRWYNPEANDDDELISAAVDGMGLNDLSPFIAKERIIEMAVRGDDDAE